MLNVNSIHPAHSLIPAATEQLNAQRLRRRAYTVSVTLAVMVAVTALGVVGAASWLLKIAIGAAGAAVLVKVIQSAKNPEPIKP